MEIGINLSMTIILTSMLIMTAYVAKMWDDNDKDKKK